MKKLRVKKGLTLIELIISIAILAVIIVPISSLALGSLKNSLKSELKQSATFHGQRYLEEINAYDEVVLTKGEDGKEYFQLLDGELLLKSIVDETKEEKYYGEQTKGKFKLEMEVLEDKTFEYGEIDNLKAIKNPTFILNLKENLGIYNLSLEGDTAEATDFSGDLIITLDESLRLTVKKANGEELFQKNNNTSLGKKIIIYADNSTESQKKIEIENKTSEMINVYVIKENESKANINVAVREGSLIINDNIKLKEENLAGKRFNYSIRVKDSKDNVIFEGSSSRNLIIKSER